MNINTQSIYNKIKEDVQNKLNQSNHLLSDNLKESIHKAISDNLEGKVKESKVDQPMLLWDSWSIKQKVIWFFMNRIGFGFSKKKEYYASWNSETKDYDLPKPFWIEDKPKQVLVVNVYFKTIPSSEYFTFKLTRLNKKEQIQDIL